MARFTSLIYAHIWLLQTFVLLSLLVLVTGAGMKRMHAKRQAYVRNVLR